MPPAKRGVLYSRARARAVAAPGLAEDDVAAVDDAWLLPPVPLLEAVGEEVADEEELLSPSVVRLPHWVSRACVHPNCHSRFWLVWLMQESNQYRHIKPGTDCW